MIIYLGIVQWPTSSHGTVAVVGLLLSAMYVCVPSQGGGNAPSPSSSNSLISCLAAAVRHHGLAAFLRLYPFIHAAVEGVKFCYQLTYLLDVWDCHTPVLQLLGQRLVRLSGQDYVSIC